MKQSGIRITGVKLNKSGKLEKVQSYASVSDKIKRQSNKRARVVKRNKST